MHAVAAGILTLPGRWLVSIPKRITWVVRIIILVLGRGWTSRHLKHLNIFEILRQCFMMSYDELSGNWRFGDGLPGNWMRMLFRHLTLTMDSRPLKRAYSHVHTQDGIQWVSCNQPSFVSILFLPVLVSWVQTRHKGFEPLSLWLWMSSSTSKKIERLKEEFGRSKKLSPNPICGGFKASW